MNEVRWITHQPSGPGTDQNSPAGLPKPRSRPRGILVVDDEQSVRTVLSLWLRQDGFSVYLASDGEKAVEVFRQHAGVIDVLLLDVSLPVLDGPRTLAAIRTLNPSVHCCFMSGDLGRYGQEELLSLGAAEVLEKPLHLPEVSRALQLLDAPLDADH